MGAMKDIFSEAERLEVKDKATMVLVELLLNNKIILQLKQYKVLFLKVCKIFQYIQWSLVEFC